MYKARLEISPTAQFINDASRASSMLAKATVVLGFFLITLASVRSFIVPERGIRALYDQDGKDTN